MTLPVENGRDRGHDPREDLRSRSQAEAEDLELEGPTVCNKTKIPPGIQMDGNLEVGILQIDRYHPVPGSD